MTEIAAPRFGLVLDSGDPERLAEFWANALDYVDVGSAGAYIALYPPDTQTFAVKPRDCPRLAPDLSARSPAALFQPKDHDQPSVHAVHMEGR